VGAWRGGGEKQTTKNSEKYAGCRVYGGGGLKRFGGIKKRGGGTKHTTPPEFVLKWGCRGQHKKTGGGTQPTKGRGGGFLNSGSQDALPTRFVPLTCLFHHCLASSRGTVPAVAGGGAYKLLRFKCGGEAAISFGMLRAAVARPLI